MFHQSNILEVKFDGILIITFQQHTIITENDNALSPQATAKRKGTDKEASCLFPLAPD